MFDEYWDKSAFEQAQTAMGRELDATESVSGRTIGDVPTVLPWQYFTPDGKPCTMGRWAEITEQKHATVGETADTTVADGWTRIGSDRIGDDVWVSTVWLGMNHAFGGGPPLIFETMIFGGNLDQEVWRYSTREEALAGHRAALTLVELDERATAQHRDLIRGLVFLGGIALALILVLVLR